MKVDTLTGDVTTWKEPGHFVSEPVFIPRPGKEVERASTVFHQESNRQGNSVHHARIPAVNPEGNVMFEL